MLPFAVGHWALAESDSWPLGEQSCLQETLPERMS